MIRKHKAILEQSKKAALVEQQRTRQGPQPQRLARPVAQLANSPTP